MDPDTFATAIHNFERMLADHPEAQIAEDRHHIG